jgi:hypothetical protein
MVRILIVVLYLLKAAVRLRFRFCACIIVRSRAESRCSKAPRCARSWLRSALISANWAESFLIWLF